MGTMTYGDIESRLEGVALAFGLSWLEKQGANPVQLLWQRKDAAATNQLLLPGDAINAIGPTHPKHLKAWLNDIKKGDTNRRKGSTFELLGMNLFITPNLRVTPTPLG